MRAAPVIYAMLWPTAGVVYVGKDKYGCSRILDHERGDPSTRLGMVASKQGGHKHSFVVLQVLDSPSDKDRANAEMYWMREMKKSGFLLLNQIVEWGKEWNDRTAALDRLLSPEISPLLPLLIDPRSAEIVERTFALARHPQHKPR
jgi:hypothetical protein